MDPEKPFGEQEFTVNVGKAVVQLLQKAVQNRHLQKEILWNQLKILQHLETGRIDEEKLHADFTAAFDGMADDISREYYEIIALITDE